MGWIPAHSNAIHDDVAGEIAAITEKTVLADGDLLLVEDSEAANAKKRVRFSNLLGSTARWEVLVYDDGSGLEAVANEAGTDWLYVEV